MHPVGNIFVLMHPTKAEPGDAPVLCTAEAASLVRCTICRIYEIIDRLAGTAQTDSKSVANFPEITLRIAVIPHQVERGVRRMLAEP